MSETPTAEKDAGWTTVPNPDQPDRCPSIDPHDCLQCTRRIHEDEHCRSGGIAWKKGSPRYVSADERLAEIESSVFVGSLALITALHDTYVEHIAIAETDGPDGPYLWCACGWRSDDLDGESTRSDNPGMSYAVHLTNAQHAAAVKALQPIVRRVLPPASGREATP